MRAVFLATFDAAGSEAWDEGRWEQFLHTIDELGRFVFGYPSQDWMVGGLEETIAKVDETREALVAANGELRTSVDDLRAVLNEPDGPAPPPDPRRVVRGPQDLTDAQANLMRALVEAEAAPADHETGNKMPADPPRPEAPSTASVEAEPAVDDNELLPGPVAATVESVADVLEEAAPQPARSSRPIGELQIQCEPGCGMFFAPGGAIAEHRRSCEAVARFKAERGVTVVPGAGEPAPLPPAAVDDFQARRKAAAAAAADRAWRAAHPGEETNRKPLIGGPLPTNGQRPATRTGPPGGLSPRQQEVLDAILANPDDVKQAAFVAKITRGNLGNTLVAIAEKGLLPASARKWLPRSART